MISSSDLIPSWYRDGIAVVDRHFGTLESLLGMTAFYIGLVCFLSFVMRGRRAKEGEIIKTQKKLETLQDKTSSEYLDLKKKLDQMKATYKPLNISFLTIPHNLLMCIYSLYSFVGVSLVLYENLSKNQWDIHSLWCDPQNKMKEGLGYWFYTFYVSKFVEYLDTVYLLLKAKPVMPPANSQYFLHIYHHAVTAAIVWAALHYNFSTSWTGPFTNSFVHVLMYGYYFLAEMDSIDRSLGGKFITPIQLIQFMFCLTSVIYEMVLGNCETHLKAVSVLFVNYIIFLLFFAKILIDKRNERITARKKREAQKKRE